MHSKKHLGPILTFRSTCTRIKRHDCVAMIIFTTEHVLQFKVFQFFAELFNFNAKIIFYIFTLVKKLKKYANTFAEFIQFIPFFYKAFFPVQFLHCLLSFVRIIPKFWILSLLLQFYNSDFSFIVVKDT